MELFPVNHLFPSLKMHISNIQLLKHGCNAAEVDTVTTFCTDVHTIYYRERTIIGSVSYRNRYWVFDIGYFCIGQYYMHYFVLISHQDSYKSLSLFTCNGCVSGRTFSRFSKYSLIKRYGLSGLLEHNFMMQSFKM